MRTKNILFGLSTFFIALLLISFVSAQCENYGTFKQGETINLIQTCSDCSYINITGITNPSSINVLSETPMILTSGQYKYTFTNGTDLGTYLVTGKGDDSFADIWCYSLQITPSGESGNSNIVFFIFVIFFIYSINLFGFFGKNEIMTILGGMALIFLGIYMINNGIIIFRDTLTNYIAYLTIAWGAMSSIWAGLALMDVL